MIQIVCLSTSSTFVPLPALPVSLCVMFSLWSETKTSIVNSSELEAKPEQEITSHKDISVLILLLFLSRYRDKNNVNKNNLKRHPFHPQGMILKQTRLHSLDNILISWSLECMLPLWLPLLLTWFLNVCWHLVAWVVNFVLLPNVYLYLKIDTVSNHASRS